MNKNEITEEMLSDLRERVRPYHKEKRFSHVLGVEREAEKLGKMYLPDKVNKLRAAALLHDITKKLTTEENVELLQSLGMSATEKDLYVPRILHAKTAAALIPRDFPEYADGEIISAVRYHSTGRDGMTVFEALIYLADYIEDTRTFDECVELRNYFYSLLKDAVTEEDKITALYKTMLKSCEMSIEMLAEENAPTEDNTLMAKDYYKRLLDKR